MPELHNGIIAQYREGGVMITGATTIPPYPFKLINYEIPWFVKSLKEQLTCPDVINQIESAIFAHLHIARIHPFLDGNGRTARTLQDIILYHYNIPAPLIDVNERYAYYLCLDQAVSGYRDKKAMDIHNGASKGEVLFYNFIAGKINISLEQVNEKCGRRENRIYSKRHVCHSK